MTLFGHIILGSPIGRNLSFSIFIPFRLFALIQTVLLNVCPRFILGQHSPSRVCLPFAQISSDSCLVLVTMDNFLETYNDINCSCNVLVIILAVLSFSNMDVHKIKSSQLRKSIHKNVCEAHNIWVHSFSYPLILGL